jgi:hypothetical protein
MVDCRHARKLYPQERHGNSASPVDTINHAFCSTHSFINSGDFSMAYKFLGTKGATYNTRGATYTADANGVVTVPAAANQDIADLLNDGLPSLGLVGALSNFTATTDPLVTSDSASDYGVGSVWLNTATGIEWRCQSAAVGAAVWMPALSSGMLLGRILGANMNVTTDQPFVMTNYAALNTFRITKITAKNASISLTTAAGGIYPAVSKGGTAIVAAGQVYTSLSAATIALDLTLAAGTARTNETPRI